MYVYVSNKILNNIGPVVKAIVFFSFDTGTIINPYNSGVLFIGHRKTKLAPDVTPQNAASYLGLFSLLTRFSSKNELMMKHYSRCPSK